MKPTITFQLFNYNILFKWFCNGGKITPRCSPTYHQYFNPPIQRAIATTHSQKIQYWKKYLRKILKKFSDKLNSAVKTCCIDSYSAISINSIKNPKLENNCEIPAVRLYRWLWGAYTDVGDDGGRNKCWWQFWDVADGFGNFIPKNIWKMWPKSQFYHQHFEMVTNSMSHHFLDVINITVALCYISYVT